MRLTRILVCTAVLSAVILGGCNRSPEARSAKFVEAGKKFLAMHDSNRAIIQFLNAAKATPRDPEVYYQLAQAYLAAGDIRKGVGSLEKTLDLNPKHAGARLKLAQLMSNASNPLVVQEAEKRLKALLEDSPDNPDALHALALTELKLGDPADAMHHLEQAVSAAPTELVLAASLAETKLRQKDSAGAEEVLKKACSATPKSADCQVLLGRLFAIENRLPDAEQKFREALGIDPNSGPALLNLGMIQLSAGRQQEAAENFKKLSSLPDKTFRFVYATFLFQTGRRDEAIREFEGLAKAAPDDRVARTNLIAAYQNANRSGDAENVVAAALKKNPKDTDALLQRGELYLASGKYAQSEADLNRVLHMRPDAPEVHYIMAQVHAARGATQLRRQELNEVLRLGPSLLTARLELAKDLIQEGSSRAALDILNQAPDSQKHVVALIEVRNWGLLGAQQMPEARKGIDEGLALSRTPDLLLQDAVLQIVNKQYDGARVSIREALGKSPEDLRALRLLASSYSAQGKTADGVTAVRAFAAEHSKSAPVQYFLGSLLMQTGDSAQAKQVLAAAKAANPDYAPTELALAQVDLTRAKWDDARQPLSTILAKKEDPLARKWLGMLEFSVGNQTAAIADFRKVIELQPNDTASLNNLAYLLIESGGQANEALKYAEKAVELAPDNADYQDTLGWVLYRKGLYANAVTHMEAAVAKTPDARFQYHLAMAYFKSGDVTHGRTILQAALHKDAALPEAKLAQQVSQESGAK